jgi:hypothetical protein
MFAEVAPLADLRLIGQGKKKKPSVTTAFQLW